MPRSAATTSTSINLHAIRPGRAQGQQSNGCGGVCEIALNLSEASLLTEAPSLHYEQPQTLHLNAMCPGNARGITRSESFGGFMRDCLECVWSFCVDKGTKSAVSPRPLRFRVHVQCSGITGQTGRARARERVVRAAPKARRASARRASCARALHALGCVARSASACRPCNMASLPRSWVSTGPETLLLHPLSEAGLQQGTCFPPCPQSRP